MDDNKKALPSDLRYIDIDNDMRSMQFWHLVKPKDLVRAWEMDHNTDYILVAHGYGDDENFNAIKRYECDGTVVLARASVSMRSCQNSPGYQYGIMRFRVIDRDKIGSQDNPWSKGRSVEKRGYAIGELNMRGHCLFVEKSTLVKYLGKCNTTKTGDIIRTTDTLGGDVFYTRSTRTIDGFVGQVMQQVGCDQDCDSDIILWQSAPFTDKIGKDEQVVRTGDDLAITAADERLKKAIKSLFKD